MNALNLHVYPSRMVNESRIERLSGSLQASGLFSQTDLIGMAAEQLPGEQWLDDSRRIRRFGNAPPPEESTAQKTLRMIRWFVSIRTAYRNVPLACVCAHSVWVLPSCWGLARRAGSVLAYTPHELETESARMQGWRRRAARLLERVLVNKCDVLCVVNESIAEWYAKNLPNSPSAIPVRNIPLDSQRVTSMRTDLGIAPEEMLYIHTGNLVEGRSIPQILSAFATPGAPQLVFLGSGPLSIDVEAAHGVHPNIHLLKPVAPSDVVAHVREADVALVLIEPTCLSYHLSSPNKLFEALAAGVPPLCTDLPEARRMLTGSSGDWIIQTASELEGVVRERTRADSRAFRESWTGLPTWSDEVAPLVLDLSMAIANRRLVMGRA